MNAVVVIVAFMRISGVRLWAVLAPGGEDIRLLVASIRSLLARKRHGGGEAKR
jgi:hypothetical protein